MQVKKPLVVAAIMERDVKAFQLALGLAGEADIVEARVDGLAQPSTEDAKLLLRSIRDMGKESILTLRMKEEGGAFEGEEEERVRIIRECLAEADYADIELRTTGLKEVVDEARKAGTKVIISSHDFKTTPGEEAMLGILKKEFNAGADIAKLAVKANSIEDVLNLLSVTKKASELGEVCTISMGDRGKLSRAAAPWFGSVLTYGYVTKPTAPGQLSVRKLKQALCIMEE